MTNIINFNKISRHLKFVSEEKKYENTLILIEIEYLNKIGKEFWNKLVKILLTDFKVKAIIYYQVQKSSRKTILYDSVGNRLNPKQFSNFHGICLDFILSGNAFYKLYPISHKQIKSVFIVNLCPDTCTLFYYNQSQIKNILESRDYLLYRLLKIDKLTIDNMIISLGKKRNFHCGYHQVTTNDFEKQNLRILPLDTITLFSDTYNNKKITASSFKITGKLKTFLIAENITNNQETISKKVEICFHNNLFIKNNNLSIIPKNEKFSIAHLTFGTNPYIRNHQKMTTIAERKFAWICIGIESNKNTHIDLCFKSNQFTLFDFYIFKVVKILHSIKHRFLAQPINK